MIRRKLPSLFLLFTSLFVQKSLVLLYTSIILGTVILISNPVNAQFGVPKVSKTGQAEIKANGEEQKYTATPESGFLSEQDSSDIEGLIDAAKQDPETMAMVNRLKTDMSSELDALRKEPMEQILGGMKETLDNLKLIEHLFKDKERAVEEMNKEGMIEKTHLDAYMKNPDLLEEDTRKGLWFNFVSLAVVGEFL
uniref:Uncharacterized protein n=1 Tax=Proboscia inermis TaxID=420281 RepID=A0A7S0C412_9STRA|mmetsp:Transcript_24025/g.24479  ORF Transcript_24025/g.24479 Transcript_24025/m.24479 type:complete len:195 (+) Transcript_24025:104-688(+)|eukprot:CAMPEP_0171312796 /NCGR_PEP_ID=MMETSP0816-20121228/31864_1 /TAXON_ID=420281 /ORGANISM="Proboscia inermis, Strain CCAP1064/1" /LENGTH=194 /DNA_ID=CAMNT_0011798907 /DNA_START=104 /DNA_END=691 /DNA_ORIENTATION=+